MCTLLMNLSSKPRKMYHEMFEIDKTTKFITLENFALYGMHVWNMLGS